MTQRMKASVARIPDFRSPWNREPKRLAQKSDIVDYGFKNMLLEGPPNNKSKSQDHEKQRIIDT